MKKSQVARLLAYVTGMVNQQLLLENEYLIAENRILRSHLPARVHLTNPQRATLAAIGKRLGRQALEHVAMVAKPETILGWYRKLIAQKFAGSKHRAYPGRPTVGQEITELIVRMARENSGWGYDRIAGALKNLGHDVSDQTVGNVLRRCRGRDEHHCSPPAQIRTCASTHTALTEKEWRRSPPPDKDEECGGGEATGSGAGRGDPTPLVRADCGGPKPPAIADRHAS